MVSGTEITIDVQGVSKSFGRRIAVDNITFTVTKGEIVGFLGPNGAGKTTTMRLLTSYYTPDKGRILIHGSDTELEDIATRKRIGYLPENNPLYEDLLVKEYLEFVADLRGMTGTKRVRHIERTIYEVGLQEVYYRPISELSKGYHQRVGLAGAILHQPSILILDEPTEGLDPNQRVSMRDLVKSLGQDRTVLVTTHVMQEVENTCERVVVISEGRVIVDSPVTDMLRLAPGLRRVYIEGKGTSIEKSISTLSSVESIRSLGTNQGRERYLVSLSGISDPRPQIFQLAVKHNWVLWELHEQQNSMEEVFQALTSGKRLESQ